MEESTGVVPGVQETGSAGLTSAEALCQFLREYQRQHRIADGEEEDYHGDGHEESALEDMEAEDKEEEKKETPQHVKVVLEVLERCVHLLPASSPRLRLLVLHTVSSGCQALQSHQDELLPMVHKLWRPLVDRFGDEEPVVIMKVFETVCGVVDVSGDFLAQRVVKDIFPRLMSYLKRQGQISYRAGAAYRQTLGYKSQLVILQGIGPLCYKLDIQERHLDQILCACVPYLSSLQPPQLQQACVKAYSEWFIPMDSDTVWLQLTDLHCPCPLLPPHPSLHQVMMAGTEKKTEFTDNVSQLLDKLGWTENR